MPWQCRLSISLLIVNKQHCLDSHEREWDWRGLSFDMSLVKDNHWYNLEQKKTKIGCCAAQPGEWEGGREGRQHAHNDLATREWKR